jgi:hypothetical protein
MKNLKLILLTAGMIYFTVPQLNAQQAKIITSDENGWKKIAETTVDFEKDKDVLFILGKDRFRKLQFMAMDAPIEITYMIVHYEGEGTDSINVASRLEEGGKSRVIDLEGTKPEIGRIVLYYNTSQQNWNKSSVMATDPAAKTTKNTNTSKAAGESKENNSTKARVILWGLK